MRTARLGYLMLLGLAVLSAGCEELTGLWNHRPPTIVERDGLSYQVLVSESVYSRDAFEYRIRVTNTSSRTIERRLPRDLARPRVYRDDRWSRPVWDPCSWGCGWYDPDRVWIRLRRGEAVEGWGGEVWARDFADYRGGLYHLVTLIDTGRDRFEVLGLPAIRVY
jgi:hypothetical protein